MNPSPIKAVRNVYGGTLEATLVPLNDGTTAHEVRAEGYKTRRVFTNFKGELVDDVTLYFDFDKVSGPDLADACERNIIHAAYRAKIVGGTLWESLYSVAGRKEDRCYFYVHRQNVVRVEKGLAITDDWTPANGSLHKPHEPGWEQVGSWKQRGVEPGLQVTLWKREVLQSVNTEGYDKPIASSYEYVAELDLDEHEDFAGHAYEVLRNHATGRLTHPWVINQALARKRGIVSFKLEVV